MVYIGLIDLYRLILLLLLLHNIVLIWDYLLEEGFFVLIGHFHVKDLFTFFVFPCQSQHFEIILDIALWQHTVAQLFVLILNTAHCVLIVSKHLFFICSAKEELWVLTACSFLEEERIEFEEAASLVFNEHSLRLIFFTVSFHLLLSIKECSDSAGGLWSLTTLTIILCLPIKRLSVLT